MRAETLTENRATAARSIECRKANPCARVLVVETTKRERSALDEALLACGIVAPLVYLATDVIAGLRWEGYSFRDQTISELNAIGAPTRSLTIALGLVGYSLFVAFGMGVWRSASVATSSLRRSGAAVVAFGVLALFAVPFFSMHVREADETFSDTLHLVGGGIAGLLLLVIIAFGAAAFGKRFRLYSIATIAVTLVFTAWSGMDGADLADNLATPWVGGKERIGVYAYQLWLVVFAVVLLCLERRPALEGAGASDARSRRWYSMTPTVEGASGRVRAAALLLVAGLVAGPVGTHVYWMLGGTWGLHRSVGGQIEQSTSTGIRVVAAVVVVLLVAAVLVVLARVGLWEQTFVPDRLIRLFAWALAAIFLLEMVASFTWSREYEWWMYGPVALVIALLALVVAGSGGAWPRFHRPHRTLPSR